MMQYKVETDLDLPEIRRVNGNFWKTKYLEMYLEVVKANKGIKRLQKRVKHLEQYIMYSKGENGKATAEGGIK